MLPAREKEDWETQKTKVRDKERRGMGSKSFPWSEQRTGSKLKRAATVGGERCPKKEPKGKGAGSTTCWMKTGEPRIVLLEEGR